MKKVILPILCFSVFLISCEEEPIDPDFDIRDDYTGQWIVQENSTIFGAQSYAVEVSKSDTTATDVWVSNFYGLGTNTITVMEIIDNNILIPIQTVAGSELSGTGSSDLDVASLSLTYGVDDGSGVDNCTATWVR